MNIRELFKSAVPLMEVKEIDWGGEKHKFNVKRLSVKQMGALRRKLGAKPGQEMTEEQNERLQQEAIALCLYDDNGKNFMTAEDLAELDPLFYLQIQEKVNTINPIDAAAVGAILLEEGNGSSGIQTPASSSSLQSTSSESPPESLPTA